MNESHIATTKVILSFSNLKEVQSLTFIIDLPYIIQELIQKLPPSRFTYYRKITDDVLFLLYG